MSAFSPTVSWRDRGSYGLSDRVLLAVIDALCPHEEPFDFDATSDVLSEVKSFLPFLPGALRLGLPAGLALLEFAGTVLPPRGSSRGRFTSADRDSRRNSLQAWLEAGGVREAMVAGLKALSLLCFYQHPSAQASLGIDWQARADRLTLERGKLMAAVAAVGGGTDKAAADAGDADSGEQGADR
ncbi:MAG TPA: hypothetical protein EYG16_04670 [Deltaproteobacteria bacterium]|nr:hypothetical protein [Candidatus Binatota bacterium]HIL12949.1 hypothetical protein [Deltaproteobacteria bacterium]